MRIYAGSRLIGTNAVLILHRSAQIHIDLHRSAQIHIDPHRSAQTQTLTSACNFTESCCLLPANMKLPNLAQNAISKIAFLNLNVLYMTWVYLCIPRLGYLASHSVELPLIGLLIVIHPIPCSTMEPEFFHATIIFMVAMVTVSQIRPWLSQHKLPFLTR